MVMSILTALIICLGGYTTMFGQTQGQHQELTDEILAVIYHADAAEVVTLSDIRRPMLGGGFATLKDKVLEELMIIDAQTLGISVTREDAEDFMAKLQKTRGIPRSEMLRMFEEFGYSLEEGLEALRRRQIIEQIVDFRVRSDKRMVVQKEEMVTYLEEHPRYDDALLVLEQVAVPADQDKGDAWTPTELDSLSWEEPFEVRESELPADKQFVLNEPLGKLVGREVTDEGIELTRLVEKYDRALIPVESRLDEAAMVLGQQRFITVMTDYQKMLLDRALIRFSHESDRLEVLGDGVQEPVQ
ncbi:MAG: hypothetical protein UV79_C0017G0004 [candidate division TM6 bacterium GW2011_GWF2_43_17]|nr:MAG: hypothetical protein UV79_C0017G0004 [candidate division TM6 bacterium GW2011_GWF2_43_17]HAU30688.1 hypothetical protein [Candidatus Dependentiae bacterium]